jgi:hypothetical protein
LTVIDTCWSAALAFSTVDTVRGADFETRHLILSLRAGEPYRIARGLALEVGYSSIGGLKTRERTARLLAKAEALASQTGQPHAIGLCNCFAGAAAYLEGRWGDARRLCAEAERIFRERCSGVAWESATARVFGLWSLFYLGELAEMSARVPQLLKEAEERGDLYDATNLRTSHTNAVWLALGAPDEARAHVAEGMRRWSVKEIHLQHYYELYSLAQIELYRGRGGAAWERIARELPKLASSVMRIQTVRIELTYLRARAALASGVGSVIGRAEADARALERERAPWSDGLAGLVRALLAERRGDDEGAARAFKSAIERLESASMQLHAMVARRRLGELLSGEEGRALRERATEWMGAQRIADPDCMTALLAPGRESAGSTIPRGARVRLGEMASTADV